MRLVFESGCRPCTSPAISGFIPRRFASGCARRSRAGGFARVSLVSRPGRRTQVPRVAGFVLRTLVVSDYPGKPGFGTKRGTFQPPIRGSALTTTRCPEAPVAKSRCLSHGTEAGAGLSEPCARDDYARARTRESAHACSRDPLCSGRVARSASSLEVGERDSVQLRTRSHTAVRSSGPRRLQTCSRVQHDLRLE